MRGLVPADDARHLKSGAFVSRYHSLKWACLQFLLRMPSPTILCIEDDTYIREILVDRLQQATDTATAIYEAADGATGLSIAREHRPDLVILDVGLPDINGLQVAGALSLLSPRPRVLILTSYAPEQVLTRIHCSQVSGLLLKSDTTGTELIEALHAVLNDRPYFSRQVLAAMEAALTQTGNCLKSLTPLELELLPLFGSGWINERIACHTRLSAPSIQNHRQSILSKLGLPSTEKLIQWAIINGISNYEP